MEPNVNLTIVEDELLQIRGLLNTREDSSDRMVKLLGSLLVEKAAKEEQQILTSYIINADDSYVTPTISNPKYNRARVFISGHISTGASAGVNIQLRYGNVNFGELMEFSTGGSMVGASESVDINQLSGFTLAIINLDTSHEVKINNLRIVLYNE